MLAQTTTTARPTFVVPIAVCLPAATAWPILERPATTETALTRTVALQIALARFVVTATCSWVWKNATRATETAPCSPMPAGWIARSPPAATEWSTPENPVTTATATTATSALTTAARLHAETAWCRQAQKNATRVASTAICSPAVAGAIVFCPPVVTAWSIRARLATTPTPTTAIPAWPTVAWPLAVMGLYSLAWSPVTAETPTAILSPALAAMTVRCPPVVTELSIRARAATTAIFQTMIAAQRNVSTRSAATASYRSA